MDWLNSSKENDLSRHSNSNTKQVKLLKTRPTCAQRACTPCFQLCVSDSNINSGNHPSYGYPLSKPFRSCFSGGRQISKTSSWRWSEMGWRIKGPGKGLTDNCLEPVTIKWFLVLVVLLEHVGFTRFHRPQKKITGRTGKELRKSYCKYVNLYIDVRCLRGPRWQN